MSKQEKLIFAVCALVTAFSWKIIPFCIVRMNEAKTSFMSEMFFLPVIVTGICISMFSIIVGHLLRRMR